MKKIALLFCIGIAIHSPAWAVKNVSGPDVKKGSILLESRFGYQYDDRQSRDGTLQQTYLADYGLSEHHALRLIARARKPDSQLNDLSSFGIEHRFQFIEKKDHGWDAATRIHYIASGDSNTADILGTDFLARFDTGGFIHTANATADIDVGRHREESVEVGLAWKTQTEITDAMDAGLEWFGDIGRLSRQSGIDDQEHSIGPVVSLTVDKTFSIETGYQVGLTDAATDGLFKLHLRTIF